ncbi:uncharacterized protein LOC126670441 [Mercurialis annua]|uniref:uncharacterized protein LOC126670441 n=1 Tax=Mercurialis annua TaxID=3986 RepID=UPI00215F4243|nr:uncharacterized protein LOC126670441 [Mercurialis annua]XP_050220131.1 uncharacterized protein LOC126670441 [Mercurialis annua]XP_055960767.1 uncharacterized protein LOC126670441 [Mercurialis annua]
MLNSCHHHFLRSPQISPLLLHHIPHLRPISIPILSALPPSKPQHSWPALAELPSKPPEPTSPQEQGPIELPLNSYPAIFSTSDDPSPIQVATSVLLTGSIGVFLFRALRRRARRVKELKFRSSGATKTLKDEALESLKAMGSTSIDAKKPPTPVQAFLGGIAAAVIALILYKFTTTIEASLNRQNISDNFSVRQITITIRTIINGMCYLATFVFGLNSVGLFLYSGQLALNSFMEDSPTEEGETKGNEQSGSLMSASESRTDGSESNSSQGDQNPDNSQQ